MNITVNLEVDNIPTGNNFEEIEDWMYGVSMAIGRAGISQILERLDLEAMAQRDSGRFRNRGKRRTSIKTRLGVVEYDRRVYQDLADESRHCVFLLDRMMDMSRIGQVSSSVCRIMASEICTGSYRTVSRNVEETTGLSISPMGVWSIIQKMGEKEQARIERHTELAKRDSSVGDVETKILYEEADGVWLKLQGASRIEHGESKEMKVAIAYDGVRWKVNDKGQKRRSLDCKTAYASFDSAEKFRRNNEGVIESRFLVDAIKLRVKNGDGASWINAVQAHEDVKTIRVLDEFHRNKKLLECSQDKEFAKNIRGLLYEKKVEDVLECIEAQINSIDDDKEKENLQALYTYYSENKEHLLGYYDRGIEIPETRSPDIHHARLGSMESNIFTLIGDRMKDNRCCWSIKGGNNLALILSLYHTTGFESLFKEPIPFPDEEPDYIADDNMLLIRDIPKRIGHGYEYYNRGSIATEYHEMSSALQTMDISVSKFI